MPAKIAVVGSLNMDLVVRSPRIPMPGETMLGRGFVTLPGGKGANQAVAAARLGGEVTMIGRLGTDGFADSLRTSLGADGVDHSQVIPTPEEPTGVALITVDDAGRNTIIVASGANWQVTPADVDAAEAAITGADVLLLAIGTALGKRDPGGPDRQGPRRAGGPQPGPGPTPAPPNSWPWWTF